MNLNLTILATASYPVSLYQGKPQISFEIPVAWICGLPHYYRQMGRGRNWLILTLEVPAGKRKTRVLVNPL